MRNKKVLVIHRTYITKKQKTCCIDDSPTTQIFSKAQKLHTNDKTVVNDITAAQGQFLHSSQYITAWLNSAHRPPRPGVVFVYTLDRNVMLREVSTNGPSAYFNVG